MKKLLSLFALWTMLLSQSPAQVQMDRIAPKAVNNAWAPDKFCNGSTDLGVCIANAKVIAGSGAHYVLSPGAYTMNTAVTNFGIGDFFECQTGAVINISSMSATQAFQWTNPGWTNIASQFIHPLTGMQNCKFIGPLSSNTLYVGLVSRISNFYFQHNTIQGAGGLILEGESVLARIDNSTVYNPYNAQTWLTRLGPGTFPPNGAEFTHSWCEQAAISGINCWELQGGSTHITGLYGAEAVSASIHLNGTGANGACLTVDGGFGNNFRLFPMVGIQIDGVATLCHVVVNGVGFSMGDSAANSAIGILNNAANTHIDVTTSNFLGFATSGNTCDIVKTTQLAILKFVGNTVRGVTGDCTVNVLNPSGASGQFDQSTIVANEDACDASSTCNFVASAAAGTITNTLIASQTFSRMTNFTNLGAGTSLKVNTFIGACPTITFTGAGSFIGNDSTSGGCTATLFGSRNMANTGWTNTENFTQSFTGTNATLSGTVTAPTHALTSNIGWTSGSGVPSAGTCTAANGGSLFSRTDGTTTTTLYVCDNSTHVWTAK